MKLIEDRQSFSFLITPDATPAQTAKYALDLRYLYTELYLEMFGSVGEREDHKHNLNSSIEDNIGLECFFPNLREEQSFRNRKLILRQPRGHGVPLATKFLKTIEERHKRE